MLDPSVSWKGRGGGDTESNEGSVVRPPTTTSGCLGLRAVLELRACLKTCGACAWVHGPSWSSWDVAARTGGTCKTSRDDLAQCPGTHLAAPQVLRHVLRVPVAFILILTPTVRGGYVDRGRFGVL